MNNFQEEKNKQNKNVFYKNFYNFIILTILIIGGLFFTQNITLAFDPILADPSLLPGTTVNELGDSLDAAAVANAIKTADDAAKSAQKKTTAEVVKAKIKAAFDQAYNLAKTEWKWALEKGAAQAYKAMLGSFLNNLAADTATYLATGEKGQNPMFETDNIGDYLAKIGDSAAGTFLQTLGENGPIKFNLCTPNPQVLLKISLGLAQYQKPKAPACTFSTLVKNWDTAIKDKNFLPKFQDMFNPWSNDLGIALTLQTGMTQSIQDQKNTKGLNYYITGGIHAVTDPISGKIKTPASVVGTAAEEAYKQANANYYVYTGDAVADAVGVFTNTLIGKLMDKWLKKGIVTNFPNSSSGNSSSGSLSDVNDQNPSEGIAGAENRNKSLTEPSFKVRGDYNILNELAICQDPNKAGPTNCVIDQKFREAIEKKLTVKQAIDQGYLNANGVFGFNSDGLEPMYNEGYPYRSMLILRKFRILPVGWEVAAEKIKIQQDKQGTKNLKDLVDCFSSTDDNVGYYAAWCTGLVDPGWVLKAPQNFCKKEGSGSYILSEQVSGEGTAARLNVLRSETYCADEQSCVKEKSDGSCQVYGYCTEEKRTWDFNGKSCEPRDNTCQNFKLGENTFSYLQNTLDFTDCTAGNAGCKKYATSGSYNTATQSIVWDETSAPTYFNKSVETCEAADEGCHGFIRITPGKNETYTSIKEAGVSAAYDRFASTGLIYEKLLPYYLDNFCYGLDGRLLSDAPSKCSDFARTCKAAEAGCALYTNTADSSKIPAKVYPNDYCPVECVGYDTYVQKETNFDLSRDAYFIPKTAKKCSAEAVGCSQFTNLDEVVKGGEGIEYYTTLRQCLKKIGNEGSCAEFYSWEGSDESGYQLKVESLKTNGTEPAVNEDDSLLCSEAIYNLSPSNPAYNANCRQFYNRGGSISYHLYNRTVSCSEDCHPYRKTISSDDTAESCKGGVWNDAEKSCAYMAIPGQGVTCSAAQNGCREYTGNIGNDVRNIFTDDFSGGTTGNWAGVGGSVVTPSNEALTLDSDNKGNSLNITGSPFSTSRLVSSAVTQGKSYVLSFIAKASAPTDLNLSLVNVSGAKANFAKVSLTIDWQIFQTNLTDLNYEVTADEKLLLEAGQNFYIDNITLTEIVDRYYLIKDSWITPASCDSDQSGAPYALFMLGCGKYTDKENKAHYLKSFSELCSESAVGCEMMIDTKNSTATGGDSFTYVVYDQDKLCNPATKGCELLGKAYEYENSTLYGDAYIKNDPDKYSTILCSAKEVGCEAFTYDQGEKYFKDPGDQVCEWRKTVGQGESYGWYKKKVKRCGGNGGEVCLTDNDCSGITCQLETLDIPCAVSNSKTLGLGGVGSKISQPTTDDNGYWAGVCTSANSGCTEYIDPVSKFNTNLLFNGDFQPLASGPGDGWSGNRQNVILEPNTLYRLSGPLSLNCPSGNLYEIKSPENSIVGPVNSILTQSVFYNGNNLQISCVATALQINPANPVALRPVVIDYQLKQNIDATGCNGVADYNKGCVYFNARNQDGSNLARLNFAADTSGVINSNTLIKVTPDRTCGKWLGCTSYVKDKGGNNICFGVGLCDSVDEKGDCANFINSPKTNQLISALDVNRISNLTGYSKIGVSGSGLNTDYYPLGAMTQFGDLVGLANGGFEYYGSNLYPMGWVWSAQTVDSSWDTNVFSVINNPVSAQNEGIDYAREGQGFLKLGSAFDATSETLDVMPNINYIVTAYINTKNLKRGKAAIDIMDGSGGVVASRVATQKLGIGWQFQVSKFSTSGSAIKIKLYAVDDNGAQLIASEGSVYFDDIKIRPALNSKSSWYTAQSCRLYSKSDSLSCDYYEDSGARQKGWYGYCLEYDRPPGDPNTCLLWYPIDKVKGDGEEEGVGYQGKMPVYYCTGTTSVINKPGVGDQIQYIQNGFPTNVFWGNQTAQKDLSNLPDTPFRVKYIQLVIPGGNYEIRNADGRGECSGVNHLARIITNNSDILDISAGDDGCSCDCFSHAPYSFDLYNTTTNEKVFTWSGMIDVSLHIYFTKVRAYCSQITKTVTEIGQNKYWSDRVFQGSSYPIPCGYFDQNKINFSNTDTCGYSSNFTPYGSINTSGLNSANPYNWDDNTDLPGNQPLSFLSINNTPRVEKYYDQISLKNLFAQSYSAWKWQPAVCKKGQNEDAECLVDGDCHAECDQYRCVASPFLYNDNVRTDVTCDPTAAKPCITLTDGTCDTSLHCVNGQRPGTSCASAAACRGCTGYSYGTCVSNKCVGGNVAAGTACTTAAQCNTCSATATTATCVANNKCSGGCSPGTACTSTNTAPCKSDISCFQCRESVCANGSNVSKNGTVCFDDPTVCSGYCPISSYITDTTFKPWYPPGANGEPSNGLCNGTGVAPRPAGVVYCAIKPVVSNIKINALTSGVTITKNGFINLTFNSKVDSNQLPLVMYEIDWGDGETTTVSGIEMLDRPNIEAPHSLYHLYSYWGLKSKASQGLLTGGSCGSTSCAVTPKVRIKDNWGWYSNGSVINVPGAWSSGPSITVYEK